MHGEDLYMNVNHNITFLVGTAGRDFNNLAIWMQNNQQDEIKAESKVFDLLIEIRSEQGPSPEKPAQWFEAMNQKLARAQKRLARIRAEGERLHRLDAEFCLFLSANRIHFA